ncbi:hypothetical protein [Nesterenkonia pannonica]|uniref:hypothetical protein n=1 Tax=Nesterenkonia pannonica TaxID=1548602 RepID=UPI00216496CB|nr:hypothetical protein [Nesterenkonia pannonica]
MAVISRKHRNEAELDIPECVRKYQLSLEEYLDAIQTGSLDPDNIDRLVTDLDAVIAYGQENATTVEFSPDQLAMITKIVFEYTSELAKANPVDLHKTENFSKTADDDVVIDLRRHLETQKLIFDKAA